MDPDRAQSVFGLRKKTPAYHVDEVSASATGIFSSLALFFMFLLHMVLARFLSPAEYAIYGTYVSILLTVLIAFSSIHFVISRFVSYHEIRLQYEQITYLLKHSMKWLFAIGFAFFAFITVFAGPISDFFNVPDATPTVFLGFVVWFTILMPMFEGAFKGLRIPGPMGRMRLIESLSRFVFCLLLVSVGFGVAGVIFGLGLGTFVALAASYIYILRGQTLKMVRPNLVRLRQYAFPIVIAMSSLALLVNLDIIVAKHVFVPSQAGIFALVSFVAKTPIFLAWLVAGLLFPKVSRLHAQGKRGSYLLRNAAVLVSGVGVVMTFAFLFFANPILTWVFGPSYALGPIVGFYCFAMTMLALALLLFTYLLAIGKHGSVFALPFFVVGLLVLLVLLHGSLVQVMLVVMLLSTVLAAYALFVSREALDFDYFI